MSAENINGTSTLPFLSSPNEDAYPPPLDLEATDYSEVANEDNILLDEIPIYDELEFFGLDVEITPPEQIDDEIQYLHESDIRHILERSRGQRVSDRYDWSDCFVSRVSEPVTFVLDLAIKNAWKLMKEEVIFLQQRVKFLICEQRKTNQNIPPANAMVHEVTFDDIFELMVGKDSRFAEVFCREVQLSEPEYFKFMATISMQMAYRESPSSIYDSSSLLKDKTVMPFDDYISIWKKIASLKKVNQLNFIGSARREDCLWKILQTEINKMLRDISIATRTEEIGLALDDDKVWVESSGTNLEDTFGLRKVTHVRDNRKGIVSHTAGSLTTNMLYGFIFEEKGKNAIQCFKDLFHALFPSQGTSPGSVPNLEGVENFSDRGYTHEDTSFNLLLLAGGDFNNTCKKVPPFPFIWEMKKDERDPRTKLDVSGSPALFLKQVMKHNRLVTCAAFRTGTKNISTILTTTIHGHQWEGICLNPRHQILYEIDPIHGLDEFIFERLATTKNLGDRFQVEIDSILQDKLLFEINSLTLEQGTQCWFKGRQFSLTSSQADGAFSTAFVIRQQDNNWKMIAKYMHGPDYHKCEYKMFFSKSGFILLF